jgi:hypothetical protein
MQHALEKSAYNFMVGKPEGKRQPEGPRFRWKNNITTDIKEMGQKGTRWINLA